MENDRNSLKLSKMCFWIAMPFVQDATPEKVYKEEGHTKKNSNGYSIQKMITIFIKRNINSTGTKTRLKSQI